MPLQDHFHPPLGIRRHWHAFHNAWATYISSALNQQLPEGYFAEPNVQFAIEIDVATYEEDGSASSGLLDWAPAAPVQTLPFTIVTEVVEVNVFRTEGGATLVGAVELVSPANKDRQAHRDAFVSKCATLLQHGVGLVLVDVVTERRANLHTELLTRLVGVGTSQLDATLYAVAYRPVRRDGQTLLDIWPEVLTLGSPLPALPFWLRGGPCLRLDLEATYERTCREQRVTVNGA